MLKELSSEDQTSSAYIQGFDFINVKNPQDAKKLIKTDDLVLTYSFDGQVLLWALGQHAKLFPL